MIAVLVRALTPLLAMGLVACGAGDPPTPSSSPTCLQSLSTLSGDDPLSYSVAWAPASDHALGGTTHELRLLAIEEQGHRLRVADRFVGDYSHMSIAWMADGTAALSAGSDGQVHLFEVDLEQESLTHVAALRVDAEGLFAVALSPDEQHALACGHDGYLSLLRVDRAHADLAIVDSFAAHRRCVVARWSPGGTHAVSQGPEQSTLFYRIDSDPPNIEVIALTRSGEEPGAVAFGEDESEVVLGTFGGRHRVSYLSLEPETGQLEERQTFDDFGSGVKVIEPAHEDGIFVIAAHDGAPRLYHRTQEAGLQQRGRLDDDASGSHALSWSPDDSFLIRAASQLDRFEVLGTQRCSSE
jgi:WD40 repeat protein